MTATLRDRAVALAETLDRRATDAAGMLNAVSDLRSEAERLAGAVDAAHTTARALVEDLDRPTSANGPWGPGANSGHLWWSGVAWRGSPEALAAFVAGPRAGTKIDLVQLFSPANAPLAHSWDAIAGGPGDSLTELDGTLTWSRGGRQAALIWQDPILVALPVALSLRVVPAVDGASNVDGKHPQVWEELARGDHDDVFRRLGRRFAFLDANFARTAPLILEPAWELSGSWYPWSATGALADGRYAWQLVPDGWSRIVEAFRLGYLRQAGKHCPYSWVFRPARAVLGGSVRFDRYLPCPSTWDAIGMTAHDNQPFCSSAAPRAAWGQAGAMEGWSLLAETAERYRRGIAILEWSPYPPDSTASPGNPEADVFVASLWDFLTVHSHLVAAECYFDRANCGMTERPDWVATVAYRRLWGRGGVQPLHPG